MLTNQQTEKLFSFCNEKDVTGYDIQVELVDHLANIIEAEWKKEPSLDFETALNKAYLSFGDEGFKDLVKKKRWAATLYCQRLFLSNLAQQFRWPHILTSLTIFSLFYAMLAYLDVKISLTIGLMILLSAAAIEWTGVLRLKKWRQKTGKTFERINMNSIVAMLMLVNTTFQFFMFKPIHGLLTHRTIPSLFFCSCFLFFWFMGSIIFIRTLKQLMTGLEKDYPEVFA